MKITLLRGFLLVGAFLCFGLVKAQTVTGTVSDATGPLPGASVVVKGTTNGTQTDFDGNYTLNDVAADAVLVFSYIGYASQEVPTNGQTTINVTLQEDASELDEVVVVGYGTQSRRTATGAIESVKAEEFNKGVIVNPQQLIQGKSAGVQISATTGEPGAAVNVRIRGTASVRSNNNPLYVVDGIPLNGADTSGSAGGGTTDIGTTAPLDPLSFLNPNDIASIDILKDAAATAIYGSRGANGVVLITTKSGTAGKSVLDFSSTLSVSYIGNRVELLDRNGFVDAQSLLGNNLDSGFNTDPYDVIFRTSFTQNYNLSYGGGNENGSYRISMGYQDQEGAVEDSSFDRLTLRINASQRFFDNKLRLSTQATISNIENQRAPIADDPNARGDLLSSAFNFDPTQSLFNDGDPGGFTQESAERRNPLALLELTRTTSSTLRALVSVSGKYNFTDNLSFTTNIGLDKSTSSGSQAQSPLFNSAPTLGIGRAIFSERDLTSITWESFFNYNKTFGDDVLDLTLGHSYQQFIVEDLFLQAANFQTDDLFQIITNVESANTRTAGSSTTVDELQSFFFRGNYSLAGKFNFSGTVRIDGSSRFGANNRYGTFGSVGAAWTLSEEDWFPEFFDTFKLRAAYGVVGNQEGLGSAQFLDRERFSLETIGQGGNLENNNNSNPVAFRNDDLRWEENRQFTVGIDYGFLDNRISGSLEFYDYTTDGFLLQQTAAQPSVQPFFFSNVDGQIVNTGVDFTINAIPIQTEDFNWDFNINFNYNSNEVQDLNGVIDAGPINGPGLTGAFAQRLASGQPLFSFFVQDFVGLTDVADPNNIQPTEGVNIFRRADGTLSAVGEQVFIGESALPDVTLGITQNFQYKNWDLSFFLNGQFGQAIYNNNANAFLTIANLAQGRNSSVQAASFIGVENPLNIQEVSSRFIEDGSFLRLQNVTVGHNFDLSENSIFSNLRVFANAQNLFVITDYSGQDPEVSVPRILNNLPSAGIDLTAFPRPTTISVGFNASF